MKKENARIENIVKISSSVSASQILRKAFQAIQFDYQQLWKDNLTWT